MHKCNHAMYRVCNTRETYFGRLSPGCNTKDRSRIPMHFSPERADAWQGAERRFFPPMQHNVTAQPWCLALRDLCFA